MKNFSGLSIKLYLFSYRFKFPNQSYHVPDVKVQRNRFEETALKSSRGPQINYLPLPTKFTRTINSNEVFSWIVIT